jgi:hypothetical protein
VYLLDPVFQPSDHRLELIGTPGAEDHFQGSLKRSVDLFTAGSGVISVVRFKTEPPNVLFDLTAQSLVSGLLEDPHNNSVVVAHRYNGHVKADDVADATMFPTVLTLAWVIVALARLAVAEGTGAQLRGAVDRRLHG